VLRAGERIGDWIVVEQLGEGGMGAVFLCRNVMSERLVAAVKLVKPHSLADEKERFIREVETLDALRHRAVVRLKGWGEDTERGMLWLAMDFVRGEDLEHRLDRGALPVERVREIFGAIADGLRHAHAHGIFHRDIKPANIVLCEDGTVQIVDFGIAVQKGRTRLTALGMIPGTPAYMAPEIFSGESRPVPTLLDVYALGQVMYEALTGLPAFPEDDEALSTGQRLVQLMGRKLQSEALDPGPEFPDDLREVVRRATAPEVDDRMKDMDAFVEGITGKPVQATFIRPLTDQEMAHLGGPRSDPTMDFAAPDPDPSGTEWVPSGPTAVPREEQPPPLPERTPPATGVVPPPPEPPPRQRTAPPDLPPPPPKQKTAPPKRKTAPPKRPPPPPKQKTAPPDLPPPPPKQEPPPRKPRPEPRGRGRRRTLGGLAVGAVALLVAGGVVVVGLIAIAIVALVVGWDWFGGPVYTTRDVQVAVTGLPGEVPVQTSIAGRGPSWRDGMSFYFIDVPLGETEVWVAAGAECDVSGPHAECSECCSCVSRPDWIMEGDDLQTILVEVPPPPTPGPRPVRIAAPMVGESWNVFIDLGGADGPRGERVDTRTKRYASVAPGTYTLRVESGTCPTSARGCWPEGCPSGCSSWVADVTIPCGSTEHEIFVDIPTPEGKVPTAAPACRTTCPSGAVSGGAIGGGERVKVLALHPEDAYCGSPGVAGVTGTVTGELSSIEGCWMAGGFQGDDGSEYYFYKAAVKRLSGGAPPPPTHGGRHTGPVPAGSVFTIVDVHADDAYHPSRELLRGLACTATGDLSAMEAGWFAGPVYCADNVEYYFLKVAVELM